ncbi:hypothetical protein OS187_09215 [Xanthomonadaceae bacterium JHOS43]|nr:hypothetical protein [Xanthomonadaceae bacterium JHOS43]MCX7562588.1 hypothetical protein [Xanthomonadaceae bacterium XH05]
MSSLNSNGRGLIFAAVAVALLATSGCSWFRAKTGYELSPESRPLEIPPDLNAPSNDGALRIPGVAASQRGVETQAFTLQDTPASAFERIGIALGRIEGVSISESSQLLTVYTVSYEGETFLIRIAPQGDGARISAVTAEGREIGSGAGSKLVGLLRQRLG